MLSGDDYPAGLHNRSSVYHQYAGDGVGDFDGAMLFIWGLVLFFVGMFVWWLVVTVQATTDSPAQYTGPRTPPSCGTANQAWCDSIYNQP